MLCFIPRGWRGCRRCGSAPSSVSMQAYVHAGSDAGRAGVDDVQPLHGLAHGAVRVPEEHHVRAREIGCIEQGVERILHTVPVPMREEEFHAVERELQHLGIHRLPVAVAAHTVQRQIRKLLFQTLRVALAVAEMEHGVRLLLPDGTHHAERPAVRIGKNKDLRGKSPLHCS